MLMKDKFQSKAVPRGTRTIWRYLSALILLFTFAIGNVWGADPTLSFGTTSVTTSTFLKEYSTEGITISSDRSYSSNCVELGSTPSSYTTYYLQVLSASEAIDSIHVLMSGNGSNKNLRSPMFGWTTEANSATADTYSFPAEQTTTGNGYTYAKWFKFDLTGASVKCARLFRSSKNVSSKTPEYTGSSTALGNGQTIKIYGMKIWLHPASGPVDPTITFNNGTCVIGKTLDLSSLFTSNSSGAVTYTVKDANGTGATIDVDGKSFAATTAGTATVTATQAAVTGTYNEKAVDATITVVACSTTISGQPSNASLKVGDANPTLSITASNVSAYAWKESSDGTSYDGSSTLATTASFTPSVNDAEQTKYYYCEVTSDCDGITVVKSDIVTIEVEASPIIIKVELSGDIASATKVVSGSIGGTSEFAGLQNSTAPYKIGSNTAYLNVTLATGYFQPGDSVVLNLSKAGQIFYGATDNSETYLLGTTTSKSGIHYFVLPSTFPANTNSIHVGRTSSAYNGTLSYLAVYRIPTCPTNLTISGEKAYVPGDKIELTASLAKGNGEISYQWYKGSVAVGNEVSGATSAKLEIADCVAGDAGDYFCVASKDGCSDAVNAEAYTITVNAFVPVSSITISPASPIVMEKRTITLTAEVLPAEATEKVVTWSIKAGSETYASVNATTGEVTGIAEGNAVIVATATDGSGVFAEKTVVVTPFVCPTSGEIASVVYDLAKKPSSEQTIPGNSRINMTTYATVTNAVAYLGNTGGSGNAKVTTSAFKLGGSQAYAKLELDCALKEGDTIRLDNSTTIKLSLDTAKTAAITVSLASGKHDYIVPAEGDNLSTIFVWQNGSNVEFSYIKVIRPAKYDVTFNMHGHGTQVELQNILEGGKVTEPATTDITGWDFGGWFKESTFDNEWDFDNDVVNAATELHAKWTAHVTSSDATLKDLTVNGVTVAGFDPATEVYNVVLEMGTTTSPEVGGVANDDNVISVVVSQTTDPADGATVTVTAEDNSTTKTYTINFSVATSKDIELVWATDKQRCDATTPSAKALIATASTYLSASYTGSAAEGGSLNTGKTAGSKIIITAKPGYAFKAMGFYGKIEDGTCNFYNDGVVETIGTSTGDACYADVFSNDEVHEFVIELTGTNGVYIRNMQLTMIEACTPIVVAWDEEPVEFEVDKAGYAIAATANNSGTITYASADNTIIEVNASTGALTIAGLGSVALSASTPEGDGTTYCANGGDPIVLSKVVKTYYLVKFDGQNGEAADEVKYFSGDAAIAQPTDPSFPGHTFQGWFDAASAGNPIAFPLTPSASRTIYAQWTADCAGATITTQPEGTSYLTGRTATALVCEATAGAGGALTYEWFTCDDAMRTNPVAATAIPSTAVAGTFYYFCKVTEEGCAVEAFSDVATIVVADKDPICLIATTVTGATAHGAVTGFLGEDRGGDAEVNVSGGSYKMDKGKYIGVTLPDGYKFQEGDKVVLNVMTVNNATGFTLFDGKDGEKNLIIDTRDGALVPAGANTVVLPAYAGSQSVYVLRENNDATGNLNSAIDAIAVYRACSPILNKVTVNGAEGKPNALKEVVFEVAASTTQSQLEAIAFDWVSNDDAWTAAHAPVAVNAWEFGVANEVTFTDKDGDQSVYTITVNKAAASTNVELATLTVNGNAVTVVPGQAVYNYELPYGTSAAPVVEAAAEDANAEVGTITQATSTTGSATFTVTAEDGTTTCDYTINFSVSKWKEIVIWDGSYMSAVTTSPDAATGFAWAVNGFGSIANYAVSYAAKDYVKCLPSGGSASSTRNIELTVPAGYVAKFYVVGGSHSDNEERSAFIATSATKTDTHEGILTIVSPKRIELAGGTSEIVGAGTYYINPAASFDFYEIRAYLRPGYKRIVSNNIGTLCVNHNVAAEDLFGATYYQIAGLEPEYGKIAFDEVDELTAGEPYIFRSNTGSILMFYGETKATTPVEVNGMVGSFAGETLEITEANKANIMYIAQNKLWNCEDLVGVGLEVVANRCYIDYSQVQPVPSPNPAPGRRRVSIGGANVPSVATDIDNLNSSEKPVKLLIDGQLFIIRGEKIFDATGRLVK